ncbi:Sgta [Symbiodinium sp. CCMP2592]|nr:Sgta [Symbiodinium sp. CCMP2592]
MEDLQKQLSTYRLELARMKRELTVCDQQDAALTETARNLEARKDQEGDTAATRRTLETKLHDISHFKSSNQRKRLQLLNSRDETERKLVNLTQDLTLALNRQQQSDSRARMIRSLHGDAGSKPGGVDEAGLKIADMKRQELRQLRSGKDLGPSLSVCARACAWIFFKTILRWTVGWKNDVSSSLKEVRGGLGSGLHRAAASSGDGIVLEQALEDNLQLRKELNALIQEKRERAESGAFSAEGSEVAEEGLLQFFQEAALLLPGSEKRSQKPKRSLLGLNMGVVARLWGSFDIGSGSGHRGGEPDVQAAATELKVKGNEHFKKSEYTEALDVYTRAAETYMYDASIWLNRSICNRKLNNLEDAATDAEIAQEIDPSNVKAYYNRALALQLLDKHDEALSICKKGLNTQSDNKALQQLKIDLQKSIAEAKAACPGEVAPCPQGPVKAADALQKRTAPKSSDDVYEWKNGEPSEAERQGYKKAMVDMFRSKYEELKERAEAAKSKRSTLQTDHYEDAQKQSLQLSGGHRPMDRPEDVILPADYQQPVGLLSAEQLAAYDAENADRRYLLSVYGNIFDVSDRPDKYDPDGPYASLTGKDLTWGLFAGVDTVEYTNKFYDLYKARDLGKDKLAGVCSWLAWYESEYGKPVGQLEPWLREAELPAPPLEEIEEMCVVM